MISQSPPCVPLVPGGLVAPAAAARPMAGEGGLLSYEPLAANMLPSATPVLLPQGDAGNGGGTAIIDGVSERGFTRRLARRNHCGRKRSNFSAAAAAK